MKIIVKYIDSVMHSRKPIKSVDKSQSMEIYSNDSVIYGNRMRKTGGGARTVGGFNFGLKNRPIVGPLSLSLSLALPIIINHSAIIGR